MSGKSSLYQAFWGRFLDRVREEQPGWTRAQKPQPQNWLAMPCPFKGGPNYGVSFAQHGRIKTELYIDYPDDAERAAGLYSQLAGFKERIESLFGDQLSWEELPNRRACRIAVYGTGDVSHGDEHDQYIDWFLDTGTRLRAAISAVVDVVDA